MMLKDMAMRAARSILAAEARLDLNRMPGPPSTHNHMVLAAAHSFSRISTLWVRADLRQSIRAYTQQQYSWEQAAAIPISYITATPSATRRGPCARRSRS